LDRQTLGWFRLPVRRVFRDARVCITVQVLYQTGANASKGATGAPAQRRENRSVNFFTFVTEEMHRRIPELG